MCRFHPPLPDERFPTSYNWFLGNQAQLGFRSVKTRCGKCPKLCDETVAPGHLIPCGALMIHNAVLPFRSGSNGADSKAIFDPSGDQPGAPSRPQLLVSRRELPPLAAIIKRLVHDRHQCRNHFVDATEEKGTTLFCNRRPMFRRQGKATSRSVVLKISSSGHAA